MNPRAPRVLVAGGTGFLGAAIVRRLRAEGMEVDVASRATGVDLSDGIAASLLRGHGVIVHVAGSPFPPRSPAAPSGYQRDYRLVTLNLLELARVSRARFVLASTYVYGADARVPVAEEDEARPHTAYAASRFEAEELCREYHREFGIAVDVLRVFNAYGPGQPGTFVVPTVVAGALAGRISIADASPRRDFVHVDDVARAFAQAASRDVEGFEVFNIGSGTSRSIDAVARAAARLAGDHVDIVCSGAVRPDDVPDARANVAKAARVLGWRATIDFDEGLASMIAAGRSAAS
jgi:nucleoside-diphosphate-sugar epimerase